MRKLCKKAWGALRSTSVPAMAIKLGLCTGVFLFAVLVWWPAVIICVALACVFIAMEANVRSISYLLFFVSFDNMLRTDIKGLPKTWFQYIIFAVIIVYAFHYIFKTSWDEKKKFLLLGIGMCVYLVYCLIVSYKTLGNSYVTLLRHMLLLFLLCNLKKGLDFKTLIYVFVAGVLVSSFLGLFINVLPKLAYRSMEFREYGLTRFSALTGNPNRLHMLLFIAINGLFVLDFRKQISWKLFYPILAVLLALGLSTISRTFYVIFPINLALYIGLKLWRERKACLKRIIIIGAACLVVCGVMYQYTAAGLMRLDIIKEREIVENLTPPREDEESGLHPGHILWGGGESVDDPGRMGIWKRYIKDWVSSPTTFLFGRGLGSPYLGGLHEHNTYLFMLHKTGLVGLLLFAFFLFTLFYNMYKVKKYRFDLAGLMFMLIYACVCLFELPFPRITGFIYFFMFIFGLESKKEPVVHANDKTSI